LRNVIRLLDSNTVWNKLAKTCVTHSYMIQDIHSTIGKWDVTREEYELTERIRKHRDFYREL